MTEVQAHYLLIFSGVIAAALLLQSISLVAMAVAAAKLFGRVTELTEEARGKVYPILAKVDHISDKVAGITDTAHAVLSDTAPKITRITTNIAETSDVYRAKVAEVDALIADATNKARRQSDRVDQMVTGTLERTHDVVQTTIGRASSMLDSLHNAILAPVRQAAGLASGAKAGMEKLINNFTGHRSRPPRPVAFEGESVYTGLEDDYHA